MKALVADDVPMIRKLVEFHLKQIGFDISNAADGAEALMLASNSKFDLILLDIMMPEMDGEQLAKWIKNDSTLRFTYIILLTAKGDVKDRVRGLQSGADDYITKPAPHQEVLARVESGMRVRRLHGEIQQLTRRVAVLELAATVGHEINNPLNVIYLALDMMRKSIRQKEYDKLDKGIQLIAETADRLKEIARKFVELKDPESTSYIDNLNMINIHKKDNPD